MIAGIQAETGLEYRSRPSMVSDMPAVYLLVPNRSAWSSSSSRKNSSEHTAAILREDIAIEPASNAARLRRRRRRRRQSLWARRGWGGCWPTHAAGTSGRANFFKSY